MGENLNQSLPGQFLKKQVGIDCVKRPQTFNSKSNSANLWTKRFTEFALWYCQGKVLKDLID